MQGELPSGRSQQQAFKPYQHPEVRSTDAVGGSVLEEGELLQSGFHSPRLSVPVALERLVRTSQPEAARGVKRACLNNKVFCQYRQIWENRSHPRVVSGHMVLLSK